MDFKSWVDKRGSGECLPQCEKKRVVAIAAEEDIKESSAEMWKQMWDPWNISRKWHWSVMWSTVEI